MSTYVIPVAGQDGRIVYAQVRRNGRGYRRKPLRVATVYPNDAAAAVVVAAIPSLVRHVEAVTRKVLS
jgi:hypothetical protein